MGTFPYQNRRTASESFSQKFNAKLVDTLTQPLRTVDATLNTVHPSISSLQLIHRGPSETELHNHMTLCETLPSLHTTIAVTLILPCFISPWHFCRPCHPSTLPLHLWIIKKFLEKLSVDAQQSPSCHYPTEFCTIAHLHLTMALLQTLPPLHTAIGTLDHQEIFGKIQC